MGGGRRKRKPQFYILNVSVWLVTDLTVSSLDWRICKKKKSDSEDEEMLQCPAVREGNALDRRGRFITPKQLFNTETPPFVSEHRAAYASQQHNKSTWGKSCNVTSIASHPRHLVFALCRSVADSAVSSCGGLHADIYNDVSIISVAAVLSVSTGFPPRPPTYLLIIPDRLSNILLRSAVRLPQKEKKMWLCEIHYDSFRGPSLSFIGDQTCKQWTFLRGTKQVLLQPKYGTKQQSLILYNK